MSTDIPIHAAHRAAFVLPSSVARAVVYLQNPDVLFNAIPGIARVRALPDNAYWLLMEPVAVPGYRTYPVAAVRITATASQVTITTITASPRDLPADLAPTDTTPMGIGGIFDLASTLTGCTVDTVLSLDAEIPSRLLPAFTPRTFVHQLAVTILARRLATATDGMTRALVRDFAAWEAAHPV